MPQSSSSRKQSSIFQELLIEIVYSEKIAIVRYFIRRLRDPSSSPNLQANDFQLATETLIRQSQVPSFPAVLGKLLRKQPLLSKDKLPSLNTFKEESSTKRSSDV